MPDYTPKLNLPKPLGTENANRANHNALADAIEAAASAAGGKDANKLALTDANGNVGAAIQWNGRKFYKQAAAPAIDANNAQASDVWYDTTANKEKYCNGTAWVDPLKYQ